MESVRSGDFVELIGIGDYQKRYYYALMIHFFDMLKRTILLMFLVQSSV